MKRALVVSLVLFFAGLFSFVLAAAEPAKDASKRTEDKPLSKAEERAKFNPRATGMDAATRLKGYASRLEMEKASPLAAIRFRSVGPEAQGGRIVAIQAPRNRPDTLLVAFASGGLFRTENRGGSWTPLFDHESSITIGDIAVGDTDGNVLWVGTGENNSSRTSYAGTGVFKSTDAGKTWKNTGLHDSQHIGRIVVDNRSPETVYVASLGPLYTVNEERGVFKTTDGGATWTKVLFVDERTGAVDLVQDPAHPEVLYAAMWERDRKPWNFLESGPGSGIYKTSDAGATWKKLAGGFPQGDTIGRIGLAISPAKPDRVYAVFDNQEKRPASEIVDEEAPPGELTTRRLKVLTAEQFGRLDPAVVKRFLTAHDFPKKLTAQRLIRDVKGGKTTIDDLVRYIKDPGSDILEAQISGSEVWRSDDAGATWKRTHDGRLEKVFFTFGYYFGRIFAAPDDADRVFFGGVPMLASTDGGKTWAGLDRQGIHADQHVIAFNPKDARHVALGNDGGLNLSFDGGATWTHVDNLPAGQFTTIAVDDAEPYNIVGGLQDNGVVRGPSDWVSGRNDPSAWRRIGGGDGSMVQIDPKDRNRIYLASQFGFATRVDVKTGERQRFRPRPEIKDGPLRYNWITPFLISPHSRDVLWFGTNKLFRSFDRGDTWTAVSGDLTANREQGDVPFGTITSITESPKKFGVLWVGTDEGKVWSTKDGGASWTDVSKGLAPDRWVTRVVASAFDEGTVTVSQNGYRNDDFSPYVFRSTDYGATWSSLAAGLPAEPINVVREDPKAKHLLYVGTDVGVFVSLDRGATWTAMTGGLPHVPVHDLAVHPREGDVVLGTHGRSVYVADAAPLRKLTEEALKKDFVAFPVKKAQWERRRGYGQSPWTTWNRIVPIVRVAWWASAGAAGPAKLTVKDMFGNVWKEMAATTAAGMNVVEYDVTADPAKADVAEADVRKRAAEKSKAQEELDQRFASKEKKDKEEGEGGGDEEEVGDAATAAAATPPSKPVPPDLLSALTDPYLSKRTRYLPPGTYTIEVASGGKTAKTTLEVKAPKTESSAGDD